MQLGVIGPGTMGLMSAVRLVRCGFLGAGDVRLCRVSEERKAGIEARLPGAHLMSDNAAAVADADIVIFAVKPRQFPEVATGLEGRIRGDALVISVMTAVDIASLASGLRARNVVRASTNIGIEAGVATTCWFAAPAAGAEARDLARKVFDAWGDQIECAAEALLDVAMVGVGSGPALVIEFASALSDAMTAHGMPEPVAVQAIMSLIRGTAELVRGGGGSPSRLQQAVVTPGGITAEALKAMDDAGFRRIVGDAFERALERTVHLRKLDH